MTLPAGIHERGEEGTVPVRFLTGSAGTGKTYSVRASIAANPKFGLLAATTGIAAVNLGAITINSLLRYFDTQSLRECFINGWLQRKILDLAEDDYEWLVIDEVSMLDGEQLDLIYQACKMVNESRQMMGLAPIGILLTGDFCQLPPIKSKWAFEAECWPLFEAETTRLTKNWRQADDKFLEALGHIRAGRGMVGATILSQMGVEFVKHSDTKFQGTTIIARNDAVDRFNWLCHSQLGGVPTTVSSRRWMVKGRPHPGEWKNIPEEQKLKDKAYVMILSNDIPSFSYVNGDCGWIENFEDGCFNVRLVRTGEVVSIGELTRKESQKEIPDELIQNYPGLDEKSLKGIREMGIPYWDKSVGRRGAWVVGSITYYPIRLAYASTVHKTQGLTLDRVQIDLKQHFMSAPAMVYVALSRCKSAKGLRIIGSPSLLGARVKTDPAVQRWL